jgi:hypothetical protein
LTIHAGTLLDGLMPKYEFVSRHERKMAAPIERVWNALLLTDVAKLKSVRMLFLMRGIRIVPRRTGTLMDEIRPYGFLELAARQYQEIVIGAVSRPWQRGGGVVRDLDTDRWLDFDEPGYVRIGANFYLTALDRKNTLVSTETRVQAIGEAARKSFTAYWALIRRPSGWIRLALLRDIERRSTGITTLGHGKT